MNRCALVVEEYACWGCLTCEVACMQEYNPLESATCTKYLSVWADGPKLVDGKLDFTWRVTVCRHCDEPDCIPALAREIVAERPDNVDAWLMLSNILEGRDTLRERLDAVEHAIELAPMSTEAHDQKAVLLVELGEIEEAFAACRPAVFGENQPINLEAREAWIYAARGDFDTAIQCYNDIVRRNSTYAWVWEQLCDIHEHRENFEQMREERDNALTGLCCSLASLAPMTPPTLPWRN